MVNPDNMTEEQREQASAATEALTSALGIEALAIEIAAREVLPGIGFEIRLRVVAVPTEEPVPTAEEIISEAERIIGQ